MVLILINESSNDEYLKQIQTRKQRRSYHTIEVVNNNLFILIYFVYIVFLFLSNYDYLTKLFATNMSKVDVMVTTIRHIVGDNANPLSLHYTFRLHLSDTA